MLLYHVVCLKLADREADMPRMEEDMSLYGRIGALSISILSEFQLNALSDNATDICLLYSFDPS